MAVVATLNPAQAASAQILSMIFGILSLSRVNKNIIFTHLWERK